MGLLVLKVFLPYPLFWVVWIGPLPVVGGVRIGAAAWRPFTALSRGDWGSLPGCH